MKVQIDGVGTVQVDDSFASMSPEQQEALIAEIAASAGGGNRSGFAGASGRPAPKQRLRAAAQGLTLGFGDEIEAGIRSLLPGQTYDGALEDSRGKLEAYRESEPGAAIGYEIGGAMIPALAGLFTGGGGTAAVTAGTAARLGPTAGRIATAGKIGLAEGAVQGFGSGEGGFVERVKRVPGSAALGGAAGGVLGGAAVVGGNALSGIVDTARRTLTGRSANAVRNEIQRLAHQSGLTAEEIAERLANGEILGEMTSTLRAALRGYRAKMGEGAQGLDDTLRNRARDSRRAAMGDLQGALAPDGDPNILRQRLADSEANRLAMKQSYDDAFAAVPEVGDDVVQALAVALSRDPKMAEDAAKAVRLRTGRDPYFAIEDGRVVFGGRPTPEEAEIIRRSLYDATGRAFRGGDGTIGEGYRELEQGVRGALDRGNPQLADTRARYAAMEKAREAFEAGQVALSRNPDAVAIQWDGVKTAGEDAMQAFRAGLMASLRHRSGGGQSASMMAQLMDGDKNMGQILRMVLTPEQARELLSDSVGTASPRLGSVGRAQQSAMAEREVIGGSQTAQTLLQAGKQGNAGLVSDLAGAAHGSPMAVVGLLGRAAEASMAKLNDRQRAAVVELLLQEDPAKLQRAMSDEGGSQWLQATLDRLIRRVETGTAAGAGYAGASLNEGPR